MLKLFVRWKWIKPEWRLFFFFWQKNKNNCCITYFCYFQNESYVLGTVWMWINAFIQCYFVLAYILIATNIFLHQLSTLCHSCIICASISAIFCHLATKYDHKRFTYYNSKFSPPILLHQMLIDRDEMEIMVYPGLFPSIWPIWDLEALLRNLRSADPHAQASSTCLWICHNC